MTVSFYESFSSWDCIVQKTWVKVGALRVAALQPLRGPQAGRLRLLVRASTRFLGLPGGLFRCIPGCDAPGCWRPLMSPF